MAGPSVRKPAMITLSRSYITIIMMRVSTASHLLAVKGASSGGCSLCPGKMPRLNSSSFTEAPESALRPLAATSLGMRIISFIRDQEICDKPEVDIYKLHRTCSLKKGFKSLDLSVSRTVTITGFS